MYWDWATGALVASHCSAWRYYLVRPVMVVFALAVDLVVAASMTLIYDILPGTFAGSGEETREGFDGIRG